MPTSRHGNKATELQPIQIFRANGIIRLRQAYDPTSRLERGCSLALARRSAKGQVSRTKNPNRNPSGFRSQVSGLRAVRSSGRVKPDFIFPRLHVAIFVDGCFWHGCPKHMIWPRSRAAFWRKKIEGNRTRDRLVGRELRRAGWTVLRIWEHELRHRDETKLIRRLQKLLPA
jgi:DNA mismatch endonuclease, patch repair protein